MFVRRCVRACISERLRASIFSLVLYENKIKSKVNLIGDIFVYYSFIYEASSKFFEHLHKIITSHISNHSYFAEL